MKATLGICERCGGSIIPVWYRDDKETVLSHGECDFCGKKIAVDQMTPQEFRDRFQGGLR